MEADLQRQKAYIRECRCLFLYLSLVAGNCYNQDSRNCGCKVICSLLQELKSHSSKGYWRVALSLCRSPETIRQSSVGTLDELGIGLSTRYSCIDIKDRKAKTKTQDWLFSCKSFLMRFGKGKIVSSFTCCKFPDV